MISSYYKFKKKKIKKNYQNQLKKNTNTTNYWKKFKNINYR